MKANSLTRFVLSYRRQILVLACALLSPFDRTAAAEPPGQNEEGKTNYRITVRSNEFGEDELVTYDLDGRNPTRFGSDGVNGQWPAWSPDGKRIAFDNVHGIIVIDAETGEKRVRIDGEGWRAHQACWSPDGQSIMFVRNEANKPQTVWLADSDGTKIRRLISHPKQNSNCPAYAPNGRLIAFVRFPKGAGPMLCNADGSEERQLFEYGPERFPAWSPDGSVLAFQVGNHRLRKGSAVHIIVGDAEGKKSRRLTESGYNRYPAWSPDGRYLAYVHLRAGYETGERSDLVIRDVVYERTVTIVKGRLPNFVSRPAWKPFDQDADKRRRRERE